MRHLNQEKPYSCAAACLAMALGIPEADCRKLARTNRTGTYMHDVRQAAEQAGVPAHLIPLHDRPFEECLWFLEAQAQRWPLILSCSFRSNASDRRGRRRLHKRQHAVVLWKGNVYDPGERDIIDAECISHLGDRGILVDSYVLLENS